MDRLDSGIEPGPSAMQVDSLPSEPHIENKFGIILFSVSIKFGSLGGKSYHLC